MVGFKGVSGEAKKKKLPTLKTVDGKNEVRVFGNIVPRYVYWIKTNGNSIAIECLSFDREKEEFDNSIPDPVKEVFPDLKCSWAYAVQCLDPVTGKPVIFHLKKKLLKQIMTQLEDIGTDPTDLDNGWPIVFTKEKTGPSTFNVEYTFNVLASSKLKGPVTAEQRAVIEEATPIEELMKRPSEAEIRQMLERIKNNVSDEEEEQPDEEVAEELKAS